MRVYFGRTNGERTLGEIVRVNPSKAVVKTLEERGNGRGGYVGAEWKVPYSLMTPASANASPGSVPAPVTPPKLSYHPFDRNHHILMAILCVYAELEPESLTADGERTMSDQRRIMAECQRKLKGLFMAFGREISSEDIFDWRMQKDEAERKTKKALVFEPPPGFKTPATATPAVPAPGVAVDEGPLES